MLTICMLPCRAVYKIQSVCIHLATLTWIVTLKVGFGIRSSLLQNLSAGRHLPSPPQPGTAHTPALWATFLKTMTVTIKGNKINSLNDFYDEVEKQLVTGECPWGRNLDSLDEIVSNCFNYTDDPKLNINEVVWSNSDKSRDALGLSETIKWWTNKKNNTKDRLQIEFISDKIKKLNAGHGETLFDMLTVIFRSNKSLRLRLE